VVPFVVRTGAVPDGRTGPSSSDAPYLVRQVPGVTVASVLSAGDAVGGYRMAGTFDNGDGTFTVLMNHEFPATAGKCSTPTTRSRPARHGCPSTA
jgi:hypothetical protein